MDSEQRRRYQTAMISTYYSETTFLDHFVMPDGTEQSQGSDTLSLLQTGKVFIVNSRRRNGLILFKRYHAEFAGPGAAVGGLFDLECSRVIPVADFGLVYPESYEERQQAYVIRQQWIRSTQKVTHNPVPLQRATELLTVLVECFDCDTVAQLPDDALAMLVGVLPKTIKMARRKAEYNSENKQISSEPIEQK